MENIRLSFGAFLRGLIIVLLLYGCDSSIQLTATSTEAAQPQAPTGEPAKASPSLTTTITEKPSATSPLTATPTWQVCSPLEDIAIPALLELITNPYSPPSLGLDDPHQGVDFSMLDPFTEIALEGHPVNAVLSGKVTATLQNRFPYGNAIIIETKINSIPPNTHPDLKLPTPVSSPEQPVNLTCPSLDLNDLAYFPSSEDMPLSEFGTKSRSIYILYAHLLVPDEIQPGNLVRCGQSLARIGTSGNAINPHLHLEIRVGPSDITLGSMAHYDNSATLSEMANYCLWRVSGLFQLIDPMTVLFLAP